MNYGKKVYIETISHDGRLVEVGSVHSSLRRAKEFIARLKECRDNPVDFEDSESKSFGIEYDAGFGIRVRCTITEHIMF